MITIRKSSDRGHANHGWLDSYHTFSFADYFDKNHMGFRSLRVINDDRVAPGAGFGTHPHQDMEIISYILDGELSHKDSMGNQRALKPGDVQRISAGTGISHSEFNASRSTPVHFLQIWIRPDRKGHAPAYEDRAYPAGSRENKLLLIASGDGRDGSLKINQDASVFATRLSNASITHPLAGGRHAWVQVARGSLSVNGVPLSEGDAIALSDEASVTLKTDGTAEVLVFDLA